MWTKGFSLMSPILCHCPVVRRRPKHKDATTEDADGPEEKPWKPPLPSELKARREASLREEQAAVPRESNTQWFPIFWVDTCWYKELETVVVLISKAMLFDSMKRFNPCLSLVAKNPSFSNSCGHFSGLVLLSSFERHRFVYATMPPSGIVKTLRPENRRWPPQSQNRKWFCHRMSPLLEGLGPLFFNPSTSIFGDMAIVRLPWTFLDELINKQDGRGIPESATNPRSPCFVAVLFCQGIGFRLEELTAKG